MSSSPAQNPPKPRGAMRILVGFFSGVLLASFFSRRTPRDQQSSGPTHNQGTTQSTSPNDRKPIRVIVDALPPKPETEETREKNKEGRDKINLVASCVTAVLVFIYATVAVFQWCEMKKQTVNQGRSWVGPSRVVEVTSYTYDNPKGELEVQYNVWLKNFGPGVAPQVAQIARTTTWTDVDRDMKDVCKNVDRIIDGEVRNPSTPNTVIGQTIFPMEERKFEAGDKKPVDADPSVMLFIGCVAYRDQFKAKHRTTFCMHAMSLPQKFKVGDPIISCQYYNTAE